MNEAILLCGTVAFGAAFYFVGRGLGNKKIYIRKKAYEWKDLFFKALSVVLFLLFMPHLFMREAIASQIGVSSDFMPAPKPDDYGVPAVYTYLPFSAVSVVFLTILKWFTLFSIAVTVLLPFFDKREGKDFTVLVTTLVTLFNGVFFRAIAATIVYTPSGGTDLYSWRVIVYACIIALNGAIGIERVIRFFVEKDFADFGRRMGKLALYILFYLIAFMPVYAPQLLFGLVGKTPKGFSVPHRLLIYLTMIFPFAVQFIFRKRSRAERRYVLIMLALSGFFAYFSQYYYPGKTIISSLPLHLCNTAIALMFFAYVFDLKGVFYFTYLVNIMGAMMALLMPTTKNEFTSMGNIVFFYNHIYAIVLPLLGVSLKVFDRPTMKLMKKAIMFFTFYVLFAAVMDGWFNNSASLQPITLAYGQKGHIDIDYFFLYSDFFVNKFSWAIPIKYNFVWKFQVGDTLMTFYYMYIIVIYLISVALMFAFWGVYGILYRVEDSHKELARRKKLRRVDKLDLLKELNGRSPKEPLHPEGAHMIKISHFSKTYAGSDRKAVTDLNLEIHEGEVFGFIGPNGAGKSTTIKSLVGIQTITEGTIEIQGYDIARQPLEAKLNIGYVSDNHAVYEKLTGREYVGYVADLYMVKEEDKEARIAKYGEMFGLTDALDREIKSYSHGMKQKLMVISALIHNPKVWVLDEPLTGLDPTSSYQIKECMRRHADEGNIVFFSSHVIEVVEKICDRVAIIAGGKLCRVCTPEELKAEGKSLEELYLKYASMAESGDRDGDDPSDESDGREELVAATDGESNG
ncbi:MAG: YwaF family protein [Clostridia bacterium]|nr:YwaF family protein [Clostridia bacterium]